MYSFSFPFLPHSLFLQASDLLDPTKAAAIDFPESVVGLLRGDLGYPHRGFPEPVTQAVLKGAAHTKRTVRAGLTLPPVDFAKHIEQLSQQWGQPMSPEKAMSSLMYPKVFSDYMKRQKSLGGVLVRHLPTPVYLHGMTPAGPSDRFNLAQAADKPAVEIKMTRVGPLKDSRRVVAFLVNGAEAYEISVKDSSGKFVFEGPMASPGDASSVSRRRGARVVWR
jgi:pyruvate carboxylase